MSYVYFETPAMRPLLPESLRAGSGWVGLGRLVFEAVHTGFCAHRMSGLEVWVSIIFYDGSELVLWPFKRETSL